MRIALAQINPTVGDLARNLDLIEATAREAGAAGADLVVFPELCLTGYPPRDLLEDPGFVADALGALDELPGRLGSMAAVVGALRRSKRRTGRPLENCAILLAKGRIRAHRAKSLLPSYDVFDEERYFEPARENRPLRLAGCGRLGLTVCEDLWSDLCYAGRRRYSRDPLAELTRAGADLLINISASPFERGKGAVRERLAMEAARRHGRPLALVNQVGGNDELVFDGRSAVIAGDGTVLARAPEFAEALLVVDLDEPPAAFAASLDEVEAVRRALVLGIRDYAGKCGLKSAVVGLSGGIDSALTAALAAEALGPECVLGVTLPSRYSSRGSVDDSEQLARNLRIEFYEIPIRQALEAFRETLEPRLGPVVRTLVEENLQARIRGTLLMAFANARNALLLATGNQSELATGYCTLYGDMCGGLAPISDLSKTEVYELAEHLNRTRRRIPQEILDKPPSAELAPGQLDSDSLPPYDLLDRILATYVDRATAASGEATEAPPELVAEVLRRVDRAEFKRRQAPPGLKISNKAFGSGRRLPIAQGYRRD